MTCQCRPRSLSSTHRTVSRPVPLRLRRQQPRSHAAGLIDGLERTTLLACEQAAFSVDDADQGRINPGLGGASFELRSFAAITMADLNSPPAHLASTGARSQEPQLIVWVQLRGSARLRQGERGIRLETGDLCLLRDARPTRALLSAVAAALDPGPGAPPRRSVSAVEIRTLASDRRHRRRAGRPLSMRPALCNAGTIRSTASVPRPSPAPFST